MSLCNKCGLARSKRESAASSSATARSAEKVASAEKAAAEAEAMATERTVLGKRAEPESGSEEAESGSEEAESESGSEEAEDVYEVEHIRGVRSGERGEKEYLCRWAGWGEEDDTWEPAHHILDKQLIADFQTPQLPAAHPTPCEATA